MASPISSRTFGVLPAGQMVEAWTLTGRGGLVLEAITYGGIAASAARRNDILLHPGQMQRHATAYAFSVRSANAAGTDKSTRSASISYQEGTSQR